MAWAWRIQRRERSVRAPFLEEVFPTDVEADFSVDYTPESMAGTMEKIRTIAAICELPPDQEKSLVSGCEAFMNEMLTRRASDEHLRGSFEIRLVDKTDQTTVTFKTGGRPLQLDLAPVDKDYFDYKYLYGVNVTTVMFRKNKLHHREGGGN